MSEETRAADIAELARLRTSVQDLREINAQQKREIDAERAARQAFEADAAQLRQAALTYVTSGTKKDNAEDAVKRGRYSRGDNHWTRR